MRFLFLFLLSLRTLIGFGADLPTYNPQSVKTFKGEIVSIQKFSFVNKPNPYVQFLMRTEDGEYTVEAGPEWYLNAQGVKIFPGEKIEVHGSLVQSEGRQIILADRLIQGKAEVKLRTQDGSPLSFMLQF